ncbi:hypothetical protein [Paraburkholderia sp. SG-MS1]|uniref:hypothetical protein n=1 Tax=Paraburkholderia sp. SG-MS1 TaxID=2023741 RepID=UPI001EEA00C4|nr:hypothetical protein [Paraburkholderia sp. SG-MS1]
MTTGRVAELVAGEWLANGSQTARPAIRTGRCGGLFSWGLVRGSRIIPAALHWLGIEFGSDAEWSGKQNRIEFSTAGRKLIEELKGK